MTAAIATKFTDADSKTVSQWTDRAVLDACIGPDNRAWRELVRRYDAPLRAAVYKRLRPFLDHLPSDFRDDVMGAFWLKVIDNNMGALRSFNWSAGTALYNWFARIVGQCAIDYVRIELDRPKFVPLAKAHGVADEGGVLATDREPFRGSLSARVRRFNEQVARAEKKEERKALRRRRAKRRAAAQRLKRKPPPPTRK
jgi:hypothetical protein